MQKGTYVDAQDAAAPQGYEKVIPIVFATDNSYVPYAGVAINSILKHASKHFYYRIYIFHDELSEQNVEALEALGNCQAQVKCVDISGYIAQTREFLYQCGRFPKEAYYRLLIADVLPFFDKVIYLDCDLVVCTDIARIIPEEMGGHYIAAVAEPGPPKEKQRRQALGFDDAGYFNSGVFVMNIPNWRQNHVTEHCFEILKTCAKDRLLFMDQDVLNLVCYGNIHYLDIAWNFVWHMTFGEPEIIAFFKPAVDQIGGNYHILHFTTSTKPWSRLDMPLSHIFWQYAGDSPFLMEILRTEYARLDRKAVQRVQKKLNQTRAELKRTKTELKRAKTKLKTSRQKEAKLRHSLSYRVGKVITWLPRKCKRFVRCLRKHGLSHTIRKCLEHIGS